MAYFFFTSWSEFLYNIPWNKGKRWSTFLFCLYCFLLTLEALVVAHLEVGNTTHNTSTRNAFCWGTKTRYFPLRNTGNRIRNFCKFPHLFLFSWYFNTHLRFWKCKGKKKWRRTLLGLCEDERGNNIGIAFQFWYSFIPWLFATTHTLPFLL